LKSEHRVIEILQERLGRRVGIAQWAHGHDKGLFGRQAPIMLATLTRKTSRSSTSLQSSNPKITHRAIGDLIRDQPWRRIGILVLVWVILALVNAAMYVAGAPHVHLCFPINLYFPAFHVWGLPYLAAFALLLVLSLRFAAEARASIII